jgi:hypothetical protein
LIKFVSLIPLQAPLLACKTIEEGQRWMSALKRITAAISPIGRVAWTGSALVTFINHARIVPTNGFMLMAHLRFVLLGETPSDAAATAMSILLGQAYASAKAWPVPVQLLVDTGAIVHKLASTATGGLLSARPALVSHVFGLMGDASGGSANTVVNAAIDDAKEKLRAESRCDFTTALGQLEMSPDIKKGLFEMACGNWHSLDGLQLGRMVTKMLSLLCEGPTVESRNLPTLLPPYASFIKECLNEDGDVIVRWAGNKDELGDKLRGILNFHSEAYANHHLYKVHLSRISYAVANSLQANGIGIKDADTGRISAACHASDIDKVPVLSALLHDSANSFLADVHTRKLGDSQALPCYSSAIGFHVLRWARNVASHHSWAASILSSKGFPIPALDAAARAAAVAVCSVREQTGFVFRLDERGIPKRVQVLPVGMRA